MRTRSVSCLLTFASLVLLGKCIGSISRVARDLIGDPYQSIGPAIHPGYSSNEGVNTRWGIPVETDISQYTETRRPYVLDSRSVHYDPHYGYYGGKYNDYGTEPHGLVSAEPHGDVEGAEPKGLDDGTDSHGVVVGAESHGLDEGVDQHISNDVENFPEYNYGHAFKQPHFTFLPHLELQHHDVEPLHSHKLSRQHFRQATHSTHAQTDTQKNHDHADELETHAAEHEHHPRHFANHFNHDVDNDGMNEIIGHVLSDKQANKLGFDEDYLKLIGFANHKWDTNYGVWDGESSEINDWASNWRHLGGHDGHDARHGAAHHGEHHGEHHGGLHEGGLLEGGLHEGGLHEGGLHGGGHHEGFHGGFNGEFHQGHHEGHHEGHHDGGHHIDTSPASHEPYFQGAHGCKVPMDIAFLIDGSTEADHFKGFLAFMGTVIHRFGVSLDGVHVALIVFSDKGELKFDFDKFDRPIEVEHELLKIGTDYKPKKGRALGNGLKVAKGELFDSSGRDEVSKVLIVLTDGSSGDTFGPQGQIIKDTGVTIYVVAPKGSPNPTQVNDLATSKKGGHAFILDNYEHVQEVALYIPYITCRTDIVFVIDCTKTDSDRLDKMKEFIIHVTEHLEIDRFGDHVSVVTYGGKAEIQFNLNKKHNRHYFLDALDALSCKGGASDVGPGLAKAKDVFDDSGHFGYLNMTIFVTDSKPGSAVMDVSQDLRNMGVLIHAVGFGTNADAGDLSKVATDPDDFYVHKKTDAYQLRSVAEKLAENIATLKGHIGHDVGFGFGHGGHTDHLGLHNGTNLPHGYGFHGLHTGHGEHGEDEEHGEHSEHGEHGLASSEPDLHDILAMAHDGPHDGPLGDIGVSTAEPMSRTGGLEKLADMISNKDNFVSTFTEKGSSEKGPTRSFSSVSHTLPNRKSSPAQFEMENSSPLNTDDDRQDRDGDDSGYTPQLPDGSFMSVPVSNFLPQRSEDASEFRGTVPDAPKQGNSTFVNTSNVQKNQSTVKQHNTVSSRGIQKVNVTTGKQRSETVGNSEIKNITKENNDINNDTESTGNTSTRAHKVVADPYASIGMASAREMSTHDFKSFLNNSTGPEPSTEKAETVEDDNKNLHESRKKSKNVIHTDVVSEKSDLDVLEVDEKRYVDGGKHKVEGNSGAKGENIVMYHGQKKAKGMPKWAEKAYKHARKAEKLVSQLALKELKETTKLSKALNKKPKKSKARIEKLKGKKRSKSASQHPEKLNQGKIKPGKMNLGKIQQQHDNKTVKVETKKVPLIRQLKVGRPKVQNITPLNTVAETEEVSEEGLMEKDVKKPTENVIDDAKKKSNINQRLKYKDDDFYSDN